MVSLGPNKPFSNTKTSQFTICAEVRFVPACSKIPTLTPMGQPSGSLFNHTSSLQLSICDSTRFRPVFGIACLNDQINTVLLTVIRRDFT